MEVGVELRFRKAKRNKIELELVFEVRVEVGYLYGKGKICCKSQGRSAFMR